MAVASRPLIRGGRLALLAGLSLGMHAARGSGPDLSPFIGTWTFQAASQFGLDCPGLGAQLAPQSVAGTRISIYPGTSGDLTFDIGCDCKVDVDLDATGTRATLAGTQRCQVMPRGVLLSGDVESLTLDLAAGPSLALKLSGGNAQIVLYFVSCSPATFSGAGTLTRDSTEVITCGSDDDAIGVVPVSPWGTTDCPLGAGMSGRQITMSDEETMPHSDATGSHGEGSWLLPDDTRERSPAFGRSAQTTLTFCRVDGARFKPVTTSDDPAQYYAVLKLNADKSCPGGSVEMTKAIDNEDAPFGMPSYALGDVRPNIVEADPMIGTSTQLVFCYFRAAPSAGATMTSFPDLGFHYAVFHRFTGEQPPWVIAKRWVYSDDEDEPSNIDPYGRADPLLSREFQDVIENPSRNTYYDLGRVR